MELNELRFGNIIYKDDTSFPAPVDLYTFIILERFPERLSWLKGVPLSDDWLEKFGLIERYVKGEWSWANCKKDGPWDSYTEIHKDEEGWYYLKEYPRIKYVHQLQNLYFALTGQDLELCK